MRIPVRRSSGATDAGAAGPGAGERGQASRTIVILSLALSLGALVRVLPLIVSDFPLIDGGLFYTMARDIQAGHFALPASSSYNGLQIPFAYPPLGLYLAALLQQASGWSLAAIMRWLPFCVNLLTIPAFFGLARAILPQQAAGIAAVLFALLPEAFQWQIMGGGVTRAPGFLFAVLAITQAYLLSSGGGRRHLWPAIFFAGCTLLSHPQMAWFAAFSIGLITLARSRTLRGLRDLAVLAGGALLWTSPWWLTVLLRHGFAPFLAAADHGWPFYAGLLRGLVVGGTSEPFIPLIGFLALLGLLRSLVTRRWFLPGWTLAVFALDSWLPNVLASVPLGLLAGIGVMEVLLPLLRGEPVGQDATQANAGLRDMPAKQEPCRNADGGLRPSTALRMQPAAQGAPPGAAPTADQTSSLSASTLSLKRNLRATAVADRLRARILSWHQFKNARNTRRRLVLAAGLAGMVYLAVAAELAALVRLAPLSPDERQAMAWAAAQSAPGDTFLVVSGDRWGEDRSSEWLPALTGRISVATVQGSEWLANGEFARRVEASETLRQCATAGADCLARWLAETGALPAYIYVPKRASAWRTDLPLAADVWQEDCCQGLRRSLGRADGYALVYDGPGAAIYVGTLER